MEEEQPGPEWERVTAWMKRKNPNWKRVEPKMRALAVRRARLALQSLRRARRVEEDERLKGLCREAVEWLPIVSKDPTAIERMPDTFQSLPFSPSNKDIFRKMHLLPSNKQISLLPFNKQIFLQRPRRPSPPPPRRSCQSRRRSCLSRRRRTSRSSICSSLRLVLRRRKKKDLR